MIIWELITTGCRPKIKQNTDFYFSYLKATQNVQQRVGKKKKMGNSRSPNYCIISLGQQHGGLLSLRHFKNSEKYETVFSSDFHVCANKM